MTSDRDLLGKFARENSQDAFGEIVRRHLDLVYSAALRQVRSPQLAEEIAQSVFADLARNAGKLCRARRGECVSERLVTSSPTKETDTPPANSLTPWLYAVTRRTAIDVIRKESRRRLREQIAVEMNNMNATSADWMQIEPLLDDAMAALDETDRSAVLLRYFENKSLREVGEALGASEDAAQKRVSRAVERLRDFFPKRNMTIGASGLMVLISANAVQSAPVGLAAAISTAVLAGTAVSTSTVIAATKVIAMTTIQKVIIATTIVATAAVGGYVVLERQRAEKAPTAVVATGKISKQSCVFAGYATPEATFQTMLWAAARHDTNALWSCFDPASKAIIERQRNGLKGQLLLFDILTAFQVMSREATSPDILDLTINVEDVRVC